jgi:hypothetical protein
MMIGVAVFHRGFLRDILDRDGMTVDFGLKMGRSFDCVMVPEVVFVNLLTVVNHHLFDLNSVEVYEAAEEEEEFQCVIQMIFDPLLVP